MFRHAYVQSNSAHASWNVTIRLSSGFAQLRLINLSSPEADVSLTLPTGCASSEFCAGVVEKKVPDPHWAYLRIRDSICRCWEHSTSPSHFGMRVGAFPGQP